MTRQFARTAKLTVGPLTIETSLGEGLRFTFDVKRSVDLESNAASVQIFNLSRQTRALLDEQASLSSQPGIIGNISLEAGLGADGRHSLFCGDRAWVSHAREGADWITSVEMLDGGKALSQLMSFSAAPKVTAKDLLDQVLDVAKLAFDQAKEGDISSALNTVVFGGGKTFEGSTKQALQEIASSAGLRVTIQDCEVHFYGNDTRSPDTGVVLGPKTGLVNTPERYRDPDHPRRSLVRGEALLNGRLKPGKRFALDADSEFGIFKVLSVQHSGDTRGGSDAWRTSWEAQELTGSTQSSEGSVG